MTVRGTVLERAGSQYRVLTGAGEVNAVLRGKAKRTGPRVVVGDDVELEPEAEGALHAITGVAERRSLLGRRVPDGRGIRPVVANADQVVVVTAARDPDPVPQLIDRLLAVAAANDIPAILVINKVDLADPSALARTYLQAGYRVVLSSTKTTPGVEEFWDQLRGRESVVTGPSGAGKSSLLNAGQPGLGLRVGAISRKIRRGRNTTASARMIPLDCGGFVVDTPGFSDVGLWGLEPSELGALFPEIARVAESCRYQDCRHHREPACAVKQAVESGQMDRERYRSYLALLQELRTAPKDWE